MTALGNALAFLHWDQATLMPSGAAGTRALESAALEGLAHEMLTATETGDLLEAAEAEARTLDADPREVALVQANLREVRRQYTRATILDRDLVEALAVAASTCETAWRAAREERSFAVVREPFETLLARVRESAGAQASVLGCSPWEALLDAFEPGATEAGIDRVFSELEGFLPDFISEVIEQRTGNPDPGLPEGPFPEAIQERLAHDLMERLGFDFRHGRLDRTIHPFCGGTPRDVRIATRYNEADFTSGLFGVLHETGHALYEQGLPEALVFQPVGQSRSMSIHESQSLLYEMQLGHSRAFLAAFLPGWREAFGGSGPAWEPETFGRALNAVRRSFIRVEADEVTYPVHVLVRTRLERAMIAGDLRPADLPGAWNDDMERLLGIRPSNDLEGCLQDIHWYDGLWGYFPTYTLGAMTAAQVFDAALKGDPAIGDGLDRGDFRPLLAWLRTAIHEKGSSLSVEELLREATGRPLDPAVFRAHLRSRYLDGDR
ncbi:carboxypeptidase M32 [Phaeovibrio sulfidiphilus]|uniref:Metal-dependent carboxypeptidase n=1 Tax=Phaeovibrio sulfidiphilus TaxID=1220600 RepID=A0A8J6YPS2_9PROT|nr:carboxypeptidase M32 [Phaeovibrio sulfidiphilus]MBE1237421.1 carboxypeptidase M32 [Phaeovibrio sulfidiphilus]